jgi:KDO2-lipid IV(A) lauroyltransferase
MKKVIRGIELFAVKLLTAYANSLPESNALRLGAGLGALARRLLSSRANVVRENLQLCGVAFDTVPKARLFELRCFQHIGITIVEVVRQRSYRRSDIWSKVTMEKREHLEDAARLKKGAILMSGHIGNWELLGAYVRNLSYPVHLLVKRQSNREVDTLLNSLRMAQTVGVIYTDTGSRALVKAIRNGGFVAILADQYGGADSETVQFFGNEVLVPTGPAALILKYKLPLVFGALRRARNGRHFIRIELLTEWEGYDRKAVVQRYTDLLEEAVRRSPEMWLWTHRKFKNLTSYRGTVG